MASLAQPIIQHLQVAAAAFADGFDVLAEADSMSRDDGKANVAYGQQLLTTGYAQVEAAAKLYARLPECAASAPIKPVLSDPAFRTVVLACADKLDADKSRVNVAGRRLAAVMRALIADNDPTKAHSIAGQADAAARTAKMRSGRAA